VILLENSNEWNFSPAKVGSSEKMRERKKERKRKKKGARIEKRMR
jgi:hypothetical protein